MKNTVKLCECGCGNFAPIAKRTDYRYDYKKGEPTRFIKGHNRGYNLIGKKFERLTVLEQFRSKNKSSGRRWKCLCDCGNITFVYSKELINGHIKSCGCYKLDKFKEYRKPSDVCSNGHKRTKENTYYSSDKHRECIICRNKRYEDLMNDPIKKMFKNTNRRIRWNEKSYQKMLEEDK